MNRSSNHPRRKNLVDTHVQGALCKRIFLHWCTFFTASMLAIGGTFVVLGNPNEPLIERIAEEFGQLFYFALVLLSLLPAFMLDTVRFSNRFVGPIARLRRSMRELAQNDHVDELKFRENDFWNAAAGEFNLLRQKYYDLKRRCEEKGLSADVEPRNQAAAPVR